MKTVKDYHNFHFKCNVLLLAVFEKFRNSSLRNVGLCSHYYLSISTFKLGCNA